MAPKKCLLSWSSGKDSAWALHALRRADVPVVGLLTTINQAFDRVAMHAVRRSLLDAQARSIGIPLWPVPLPWPCSNEDYERIMADVCRQAKAEGIECVAFGDLFLPEVRAYRERQLEGTGLTPLFPLWELPTDALAREMLAGGLKARITCVDPKLLPPTFAGREFDFGKFLIFLAAVGQQRRVVNGVGDDFIDDQQHSLRLGQAAQLCRAA